MEKREKKLERLLNADHSPNVFRKRRWWLCWVWWIFLIFAAVGTAHAANAGGGGLPWEAPLTTLSNSVSGPVAYGLSILGIVGVGGFLIFAGGMLGDLLRGILFIVLVIAMVIAAKTTLTAFGFGAGAEVTHVEQAGERW